MSDLITALRRIVGDSQVLTGDDAAPYLTPAPITAPSLTTETHP